MGNEDETWGVMARLVILLYLCSAFFITAENLLNQTEVPDTSDSAEEEVEEQGSDYQGFFMGRLPLMGVVPPRLGEGILITGGATAKGCQSVPKTVEAYNPQTKKICKLSALPYGVYGHTLCGGLLCGGSGGANSCLKLGPAGFVKATVTLQQPRSFHLCWNLPEGVLLLGGSSSPSTTELVLRDGSASVGEFGLTHPARGSCGVDGRDGKFIIIGGELKDIEKRVTVYQYTSVRAFGRGVPSWELPNLNEARRYHSCTHVYMGGTMALVVTGGINSNGNLDTTEVFYGPNRRWITLTAKLPVGMYHLKSVTVNNRVFTIGGYIRYDKSRKMAVTSKQILVFDPWNNKTWQHEKDMTCYRYRHAVTVLPNIWSF